MTKLEEEYCNLSFDKPSSIKFDDFTSISNYIMYMFEFQDFINNFKRKVLQEYALYKGKTDISAYYESRLLEEIRNIKLEKINEIL